MNGNEGSKEGEWVVKGSKMSKHKFSIGRTMNEEVFSDALKQRDQDKALIRLSVGDPTVFGNLPLPSEANEGVKRTLESQAYNGYTHSSGMLCAREAIVKEFSTPEAPFSAQDVIMTNSSCGALIYCMDALCDPGASILVPSPGFGIFKSLAEARGIVVKTYRLQPERNWEVDLQDLEAQIDLTTSAIIFNSPSNPCGCVYSEAHQRDLLAVAEKHKLPIIADDVYHSMVFPGHTYITIASLSRNVPVLSCGSLSKRYMVPGWRLGWIIVHDRNNSLAREVAPGLARLARQNLNPCSLIQASLSHIFTTPKSYHDNNIRILHRNATLVYKELLKAPGLVPVMPAGAMYMIVQIELDKFPGLESDVVFTKKLLVEESVFCLPATAFLASSGFRIVLVMPDPELLQATERILSFCGRHYSSSSGTS